MADDEQVARELAEELRKLRVEDVLIQTLVTLSAIGYRCLGLTPETAEARDLDQTRLAIESLRALVPVLESAVPAELVRDFKSSVANLQLAYAKAAAEKPGAAKPRGEAGEPAAPAGGEAEEGPAAG